MSILREGGLVLTVTETGFGRLSDQDNYRVQKRGGKGLLNYHTEKFGLVAAIKVVDMEDDIILISEDGVIIRIAASSVRVCARPSKGVRVMKLAEGGKVVTLARVPHEEDEVDTLEIEDDGTADEGADTPMRWKSWKKPWKTRTRKNKPQKGRKRERFPEGRRSRFLQAKKKPAHVVRGRFLLFAIFRGCLPLFVRRDAGSFSPGTPCSGWLRLPPLRF